MGLPPGLPQEWVTASERQKKRRKPKRSKPIPSSGEPLEVDVLISEEEEEDDPPAEKIQEVKFTPPFLDAKESAVDNNDDTEEQPDVMETPDEIPTSAVPATTSKKWNTPSAAKIDWKWHELPGEDRVCLFDSIRDKGVDFETAGSVITRYELETFVENVRESLLYSKFEDSEGPPISAASFFIPVHPDQVILESSRTILRGTPIPMANVEGSNLCYGNSVLQWLLSSVILTSYFGDCVQPFLSGSLKSNSTDALRLMVHFIHATVSQQAFQPFHWADHAVDLARSWRASRNQEDAAEFLVYLVNRIEESPELRWVVRDRRAFRRSRRKVKQQSTADSKFLSMFHEIIGGEIITDSGSYDVAEPFSVLILTLSATSHRRCRVEDLFESSFGSSNMKLSKLPPVLMVQLNRTVYRHKRVQKADDPVDLGQTLYIDSSWIQDSPYERVDMKYKLRGVCCHIGDPMSGHYYTYTARGVGEEQAWWLCDDDEVQSVEDPRYMLNEVASSCYLLIYELEGAVVPSPLAHFCGADDCYRPFFLLSD